MDTKIAIILPPGGVEAWIQESLAQVATLGNVHLQVLRAATEPAPAPLAYRIAIKFDQLLFSRRRQPDALERTPLAAISDTSGSASAPGTSIHEQLLAIAPDIVVTFHRYATESLQHPSDTWQLWQHQIGEPGNSHPSVHYWYAMRDIPDTPAHLSCRSPDGAEQTLTLSRTTTYALSPSISANHVWWSLAAHLKRAITGHQDARNTVALPEYRADKALSYPGTLHTALLFARYCLRILGKYVYEKRYWDQWYMLFSHETTPGQRPIRDFTKIELPDDEFWADPHIVRDGDVDYVFLEVYTQDKHKGHLSVMTIDAEGTLTPPRKVLECDYHLSYPHIVQEQGRYFMIPETKQNRTIELYECREFPTQWDHTMNLMEDIEAVDTTLVYQDGYWWLFTLLKDSPGMRSSENLYLFYAPELQTTKWHSHPMNPLVTDCRYARPAGAILQEQGALIRPVQDCSRNYGRGLRFMRIETLNTLEYRESEIAHAFPDWAPRLQGLHSYARSGDLTVIDCQQGLRR